MTKTIYDPTGYEKHSLNVERDRRITSRSSSISRDNNDGDAWYPIAPE